MINSVLTILRTYPVCDIEREQDRAIVRKQINPNEITVDLLKSYASVHGNLRIVPKRNIGASPQRVDSEAIVIPKSSLFPEERTLSGFDSNQVPSSGASDMYKILYEKERDEARDYKRKYEETLSKLHEKEIELAGNKNDPMTNIVSGLAGIAPMFMNGGGVGLGNTPQNAQPAQAMPQNMQPISDKRLTSIVAYWPKIDEPMKDNIYNIVAAILTNPDNVDSIIALLNDSTTIKD